MYFIWEVEVERSQDDSCWIREIGQLFGIEYLSEMNYITESSHENKARNWYLTVFQALLDIPADSQGRIKSALITLDAGHLDLVRISARFSRYEQKSFLLLLFQYVPVDIDQNLSLELLHQIQKNIDIRLSTSYASEQPQLTWQFSVKSKIEEYEEMITIRNPIPILNLAEELCCRPDQDNWKKVLGDYYHRFYQIAYKKAEHTVPDQFNRVFDLIYVTDRDIDHYYDTSPTIRSRFMDIIHTEIMFFIRGVAFEKETALAFSHNIFLKRATDFVAEMWPRMRTVFLIIPRFNFLKKNQGYTLFFNLLELNAQYSSLLNFIKLNISNTNLLFSERFERLQFTVQRDATEEESGYFAQLQQRVCYSFEANSKKLCQIESYASMLDNQIEKVQTDFDSNTNFILQTLMFWLSLFVLAWGAIALCYDKLIGSAGTVLDNPPLIAIGLLLMILLLFIILIRFYTNNNSDPINKRSIKMLDKWVENKTENSLDMMDKKILDRYLSELKPCDSFINRINVALELITILTSGVTLGVIPVDKGIEYLDRIKKEFGNYSA